METRMLISVVIPCFNEEGNVHRLHQALSNAFAPLTSRYTAEFLFIDDGSEDNTAVAVEALAKTDPRITLISFSRNFGKEAAMTAGIRNAHGAAVVILDADLQHPPELIPLFLEEWRNGAEMVIGVRKRNKHYSVAKRYGSALYYRLMSTISDVPMVPRETDFRLIDRQVVDAFNMFTERQQSTRALIDWLGFERKYIEFDIDERANGDTSYSLGKLFHLATRSLISHSLLPLRLAGYLGIFIAFFSGLLGIVILIEQYFFRDAWNWHISGGAQLGIIDVFLVGIVLSCLGIIALYIENIHSETMNRPMYVMRKKREQDEF